MKTVNLTIIVLCLLCNGYTVVGQENVLFYEIQKAKESYKEFRNVSVFKKATTVSKNNNQRYFIDSVILFDYNSSIVQFEDKAISLTIPTTENDITLELIKVPSFFYEIKLFCYE